MKIMARYSLRNQNKIKKVLGNDFHYWLRQSLKARFNDNTPIQEYTYEYEPRFKFIHVDNVQPNTDSFFELCIISKHFDVYNLAYYSCAG